MCNISFKGPYHVAEKGGMQLTKFQSNCKEVMDALPESERASSVTFDIDAGDENIERVLGVSWETKRDMFAMKITDVKSCAQFF